MLFAVWITFAAYRLRMRRIAERRAAGIVDNAQPQSKLFVFGEIMRPIILFALVFIGAKVALAYFWLDAQRYFSLFDLGGFLAALTAYGAWVVVSTRYLPVSFYLPAASAGATPTAAAEAMPARESADA